MNRHHLLLLLLALLAGLIIALLSHSVVNSAPLQVYLDRGLLCQHHSVERLPLPIHSASNSTMPTPSFGPAKWCVAGSS